MFFPKTVIKMIISVPTKDLAWVLKDHASLDISLSSFLKDNDYNCLQIFLQGSADESGMERAINSTMTSVSFSFCVFIVLKSSIYT